MKTERYYKTNLEILHSAEDASVNFIRTSPEFPGKIEARYVRRAPEYFIAYLSSQTGCKMGCSFCWLTRTKQTKLIDVPADMLYEQALDVLSHYKKLPEAEQNATILHYSGMARGEMLASKVILNEGDDLFLRLMKLAKLHGLLPRVMVSSILPKSLLKENGGPVEGYAGKNLAEIFPLSQPNIYYSLYSTNEAFRKKWLPNAMQVEKAMEVLCDYQDKTNKIIRLHWALIKDENDSIEDIENIVNLVDDYGLRVDVNLVRYNPFEGYGEEAPLGRYMDACKILEKGLPKAKVKVVDRVGVDCFASCGMFTSK